MLLDSSVVLSLLKFKSISTEFLFVTTKLKTTEYENGLRSLGIFFLIKETKQMFNFKNKLH